MAILPSGIRRPLRRAAPPRRLVKCRRRELSTLQRLLRAGILRDELLFAPHRWRCRRGEPEGDLGEFLPIIRRSRCVVAQLGNPAAWFPGSLRRPVSTSVRAALLRAVALLRVC